VKSEKLSATFLHGRDKVETAVHMECRSTNPDIGQNSIAQWIIEYFYKNKWLLK
jgi:hypothetical protein